MNKPFSKLGTIESQCHNRELYESVAYAGVCGIAVFFQPDAGAWHHVLVFLVNETFEDQNLFLCHTMMRELSFLKGQAHRLVSIQVLFVRNGKLVIIRNIQQQCLQAARPGTQIFQAHGLITGNTLGEDIS